MTKKSVQKRNLILKHAEKIFIEKGFSKVTLKDIVEAANISRGGIYLYFNSVDEIFTEVIKKHHEDELTETCSELSEEIDFFSALDHFFSAEKERLLGIGNTLKLAMIEYFLTHKEDQDKTFFLDALQGQKYSIQKILLYGFEKKYFTHSQLDALIDLVMIWRTGLEELALSTDVTEAFLDTQINLLKKMIVQECRGNL